MLNEASRHGIVEILASLDDPTLLSLATTVTTGFLKNKVSSREEATTAILNYSPDALSFLRRKIITRDILFTYLHKKNIPLDLPATKTDLVRKIANLWKIHYEQEFTPVENNNVTNEGSVDVLAKQFSEWFYNMLNKNECLNHEHFYPDAKLVVNMTINGAVTSEVVENNSQEVVQKLYNIRSKYNLLFNPNLSGGGVQGKIDPHGLVLVLVCGTLHMAEACVGVFEQVFGLVRDPQCENNWKIKTSQLNLKSQSGVSALPTLEGSSLLSISYK